MMFSFPATESPSHWYALYLRSRFEKTSHAEFLRNGVESFLPLIEEIHVWSDRRKKVLEPLFRGYLFVRSDLSDRVNVLQTPGVVQFVGIRGKPSPIPDEQINWIRILTNSPDAIRREDFVDVGEQVRIGMGPFKGVEGFVTKVKDTTRVVVSLTAIAQSVSVEVAPEFLERTRIPVRTS